MIDLLSGINATLLLLSGAYLFFILKYQYLTREDMKSVSLSRFSWSVSVAAAAIFVSSVLFFLHDFNIIYRSNQRDLSVITRFLFVVHLLIAYTALEWKNGKAIVPAAIGLGLFIFILRTLS